MTIRYTLHTWSVQVLTACGWVDLEHAELPTTRFATMARVLNASTDVDDRCRILRDGHPLNRTERIS